jgi:hypothetical protein
MIVALILAQLPEDHQMHHLKKFEKTAMQAKKRYDELMRRNIEISDSEENDLRSYRAKIQHDFKS